jgi:hypothetical protein
MKQAPLKLRSRHLDSECISIDSLTQGHDGEHVEMEIGCAIVMSIKKTEMA